MNLNSLLPSQLSILFFVLVLSLLNCRKSAVQIETAEMAIEFNESEENYALEEIARMIVEISNDANFRSDLKDEVSRYYNDDYVKIMRSRQGKRDKDDEVIKLLKKYSKSKDLLKINELISKIPNYEIMIPELALEWDARNYKPLVAYIPNDFDEDIHDRIIAFDEHGETRWLSLLEEPKLPVILIRPVEDIDWSKYEKDHSRRVQGNVEFIKKIRIDYVQGVERWSQGPWVELKVITIGSKNGRLVSTDYINVKRRWVDYKYRTVDHKLGEWRSTQWGSYLTMQWIEEDGGSSESLTFSYKTEEGATASFTVQIKDKDDDLGLKTINFTDVVGSEYNTGKIKWKNHNTPYCPFIGGYDGANCYVGSAPSGSLAHIYNNKFYYTRINGSCPMPGSYFDGIDCFVSDIPSQADPFIYDNNWYVQPYDF